MLMIYMYICLFNDEKFIDNTFYINLPVIVKHYLDRSIAKL